MKTDQRIDATKNVKLPNVLIKSSMILKAPLKNGKKAIFSNLTGAICVVDDELELVLDSFSKPMSPSEIYGNNHASKKAVEQLFLGGFLVNEGTDEVGILKKTIEKMKEPNTYGFMFIMTLRCNFRCVYCYEERNPIEFTPEMADKCIEFMIKKIKESGQKTVRINFYGGEPLFKFDMIKYILTVLEEKLPKEVKIATSIVTNGSLLTVPVAQFLKKYNCGFAQITVDGLPENHNKMRPYANGKESFSDVIAGLKVAIDHFPMISLRINIDKTNIEKVPDFLNWLKENNLRRENVIINFGQVRTTTDQSSRRGEFCIPDYSWGKELLNLTKIAKEMGFKSYFELPRLQFCGAFNKGSVIFNPDGTLITCWEAAGNKKDYVIGDINKDPVYNENAKLFWNRSPLDFEKCSKCDIVSFCGGGCISSAFSANGNLNSVWGIKISLNILLD